jgi:hypothetical protein
MKRLLTFFKYQFQILLFYRIQLNKSQIIATIIISIFIIFLLSGTVLAEKSNQFINKISKPSFQIITIDDCQYIVSVWEIDGIIKYGKQYHAINCNSSKHNKESFYDN